MRRNCYGDPEEGVEPLTHDLPQKRADEALAERIAAANGGTLGEPVTLTARPLEPLLEWIERDGPNCPIRTLVVNPADARRAHQACQAFGSRFHTLLLYRSVPLAWGVIVPDLDPPGGETDDRDRP